jgi:hypothetical protein
MSADEAQPTNPTAPDTDAGTESAAEATKRKFREALEAKKGRRGEDHIDDGQKSNVHAHGPVDSKRVFRRKTG